MSPAARRTVVICAILFIGTCALFSRALNYGFTNFDDPTYLTSNHHVQAGLTGDSLVWAFTGRADYWHPLTWLSHMLDWQIYGDNAAGHRATSILWHALNAVLVFVLLRRLTGAWWISALCAALFAWHPLRVESVVWLPERKDVMSGCFFLLTIWSYARHAGKQATNAPGVRSAYALTLAAFFCALMSKPVMVALPGLLLLLDFWPLRRVTWSWSSFANLLYEKVPFFVLSVAIALVTLRMQHHVGALTSLQVSFPDRVGNALISLTRYVGKFFWPHDLAVIYPHPGSWPLTSVLAAIACVLALTALACWQWQRRPWLAVGWGWFVVMLVPSIGLVQAGLQAMADRYTYVTVIGLQIALLWTVREWVNSSQARRIAAVGALVVLFAYAARTWDQQRVWRDPQTLYAHAIAVTSNNYPAHTFQSLTLASENRLEEAEAHALRALALKPDFPLALDALAVVRRHQGRLDEAMAALRRLLEVRPESALVHSDLGEVLTVVGRLDEATEYFTTATRLDANLAQPHLGLAKLAMQRNDPAAAMARYEKALELAPATVEAHNNLAALLDAAGRTSEAESHFKAAINLAPRQAEIRANYAGMLRKLGRNEEAIGQMRTASALRPDDANFHAALALGLEHLGRGDEATAHFRRAAELRPDDAVMHLHLGDSLARRGDLSSAVAEYEVAIRLRPTEAELHARLGYALMALGRTTDAVRAWEETVRLSPDFPGIRERLAQARARVGAR